MRRWVKVAAATLIGGTVVPGLPVPTGQVASAATTELFISEYIEGSSNNKAIEIYNGTGGVVDLAGGSYDLQMFFNGSASAGLTIALSGSVASGDVHVVAQSAADASILAQSDQTSGAGFFNGDDAVVLRKDGTIIDVVGQIGFDPGSEWGSGDTSTADNTLRRNPGVCAGDPDGSNSFDPSVEWDGFAQNTFDGLGSHAANCTGGPPTAVINEFSASTTGVDVEYVELYGTPGADLSALTILEIEGDSSSNEGTVDEVISVGSTDASGFSLASLPADALENGTISVLLVDGFTGALGDDLDTDDDGVLDVAPWTALVDAVAVSDGGGADRTYGVPVLGPNYDGVSSFAPGGASRIPDGADTDATADWVRNDFDLAGIPGFPGSAVVGEAFNTPGAPNEVVVPLPGGECGESVTLIHDIQGSGALSLLDGQTHSVEAVVTHVASGLGGFYLQEEDAQADGDPSTSEGIFVFTGAPAVVAVGDLVRVTGTVDEFGSTPQTEITGSPIVTVCSAGAPVPAATSVILPVTSLDDPEAVEGMLVSFPQSLAISEYFNFDRFGEVVIALPDGSDDRPYTPTAVVSPGGPANAVADLNARSRITVDDGRTAQNPDPAIHPGNGATFDLTNTFRGGDTITGITGVIDHSFGLYRLQPTQYGIYDPSNPRPASPEPVGGDVRVASMNVLNYFLTLDQSGNRCGPLLNQDCRGADNATELSRQRDKILAALRGLDADIVGLIELENTAGVEPAADLVAGLNDALGAGTYDFVDTGVIGGDAIRVAIVYQPDVVTPIGPHAILDGSVDSRFIDTRNRPVLAQAFEAPSGRVFTVAVNHLKSKGSACDPDDPDVGDGQGNCNLTRTSAAEALADWLATDPTGAGTTDSLIIGDLNSYDKEDPISVLTAAGYTDLIAAFGGEKAYSYVFDGQFGYLDHALASSGLAAAVTGATEWHINADEPDILDYDTSFKQDAQDALYEPNAYRSSDHDPVIVGLDTTPPSLEVELSHTVLWPPNHKYRTVTATVTATDETDPAPAVRLVSVTSDEPDDGWGDGRTRNDVVIVDDTTFRLRAERSWFGDGRTYTVRYEAEDAAGNVAVAEATVEVPKWRRPHWWKDS